MPKVSTLFGIPHPHIKRAVVWYLVVLLAGAIAIYILYHDPKLSDDPAKRAEQLDVKSYSLGGQITAIDKDNKQLTIKTGWVQKTEKGSEFVYYTRIIQLSSDIKLFSTNRGSTNEVITEHLMEYFRIGDTITVYATGTPYQTEIITAAKIEVIR